MIAYFESLYHLTAEMAPFLLLGFLIAGVLKVFVSQRWLTLKLGKNNIKSVIYGALIGVPLPLCSCGVIPTGVSIRNNGASDGSTISFLISTPQTGVDSVAITWSLLGWPFALMRPIIAFITGVFGGALANAFNKKTKRKSIDIQPLDVPVSSTESFFKKIKTMLHYSFVEFMDDIVKWLVIGLLLAAAIDVAIPQNYIVNHLGNSWIEMGLALVISIPLYICATGSVPLAAVLMLKGLSPGAALVLLMAGPATNAATITVISRTMGNKNLAIYLFAIISGALFFGALANMILPADYLQRFITHGGQSNFHEHQLNWISIFSAIVLSILLFAGIIRKTINKFKKFEKDKNMDEVNSRQTIIVEGMTCHHCEANVVRSLTALDNVAEVDADLNTKKVSFSGENADFNKIEEVINSIGYKYINRES